MTGNVPSKKGGGRLKSRWKMIQQSSFMSREIEIQVVEVS